MMAEEERPVNVGLFELDERLYPRLSRDYRVVRSYAAALETGSVFPPVLYGRIGKRIVLLDGWHRLAAFKAAGRKVIPAIDLGPLTEAEAFAAAVEANTRHGLALSQEERERAYRRLKLYAVRPERIVAVLRAPLAAFEKRIAAAEQLRAVGAGPVEVVKPVMIVRDRATGAFRGVVPMQQAEALPTAEIGGHTSTAPLPPQGTPPLPPRPAAAPVAWEPVVGMAERLLAEIKLIDTPSERVRTALRALRDAIDRVVEP